ncbi:JAB domain-containing protein [Croceitalea sp. MTPC9]|uniref:JAB domain-containing protein n=1 Tax=unclassified Croceitalea TaxID=2632280 RepID=UPI002B39E132|nr:JAB domain-containing protein [Croceitalea sp. MTPC6]GMN16102.1 JAB domain-containing protein [Croceitalea sp. MTPC9]
MNTKVNEIKVSYKERVNAKFWKKIQSSQDAAEVLYEHWDKDTIGLYESFKVVFLNNSNKVKGIYELSKGGITGTLADVRILFGIALKTAACAVLISHNHPSGKLEASGADKDLTSKIKKAGDLLDIKVLDHLIIVPNGDYYSFADNGLL